MADPDSAPSRTEKLQRLFELAAGQSGCFTAAQARELGYSARSLVHHVAAGHVERISRGFYRLVGVPAGPHDDIVAAWLKLAPRHAVVSHDSALALYDLAPSRSHEIHLTLPRACRPRTPRPASAVALHTTTLPLGRDEVTNRFGVRDHVARTNHRRHRRDRRRSQRRPRSHRPRTRDGSPVARRTAGSREARFGSSPATRCAGHRGGRRPCVSPLRPPPFVPRSRPGCASAPAASVSRITSCVARPPSSVCCCA